MFEHYILHFLGILCLCTLLFLCIYLPVCVSANALANKHISSGRFTFLQQKSELYEIPLFRLGNFPDDEPATHILSHALPCLAAAFVFFIVRPITAPRTITA